MKTITTNIAYAYLYNAVLLPNIKTDDGYKTRLTLTYELKDEDGVFIKHESVEHYSDATEDMLPYAEYTEWRNDNEAAFVAADKLELAGYEP